jgi:hypothetical protein
MDSSGARLSAGEQLAVATAEQLRFLKAMDSKLCDSSIHIWPFSYQQY